MNRKDLLIVATISQNFRLQIWVLQSGYNLHCKCVILSVLFTLNVLPTDIYTYLNTNFDVLLTVHLSIFVSVINQLDAQSFCFTISLFHASTCFEHMCSSSGSQNCFTQPLISSHLPEAV